MFMTRGDHLPLNVINNSFELSDTPLYPLGYMMDSVKGETYCYGMLDSVIGLTSVKPGIDYVCYRKYGTVDEGNPNFWKFVMNVSYSTEPYLNLLYNIASYRPLRPIDFTNHDADINKYTFFKLRN